LRETPLEYFATEAFGHEPVEIEVNGKGCAGEFESFL
jgi:hypothetical protein